MAQRDPESYGPKEKLLLVEGEDDKHFFWNILECHGITGGVRVEDKGGYSEVRKLLPVLLRAGNQTHLGVVIDADSDPKSRWQAIRDVLLTAGYVDVPADLTPEGIIVGLTEPQTPPGAEPVHKTIVGVWMMPDNASQGALEEFAYSLVPPENTLWKRAVEAVAAIPPSERLFGPTDVMKANLHTWLAWQARPGQPIGRAIKANELKHQEEPAQRLVNWVRHLFELDAAT